MSFAWGMVVETRNQRVISSFVVAIGRRPTLSPGLPTLSNDAPPLALDQPQAARCPSCGYLIGNWNAIIPIIDACGFESYRLRCEECEEQLGGIIDTEDGQLLLVKLEGSIWSSSP